MAEDGEATCMCDMRGMLSFLILFILSVSGRPMNGSGIAAELGARKGTKPSPGTIYPALKALREAGLVVEEKSGKSTIYRLTPAGKRTLCRARVQFCKTFLGVFE